MRAIHRVLKYPISTYIPVIPTTAFKILPSLTPAMGPANSDNKNVKEKGEGFCGLPIKLQPPRTYGFHKGNS